ncbi:MAG: hypothetical protein ACOC6H_04100 [Thermoproteota archaeon]
MVGHPYQGSCPILYSTVCPLLKCALNITKALLQITQYIYTTILHPAKPLTAEPAP